MANNHHLDVSPNEDKALFEEGMQFLVCGKFDFPIADCHKMYGRHLLTFEVDESNRTVRFRTPDGIRPGEGVVGFVESSNARNLSAADLAPNNDASLAKALSLHLNTVSYHVDGGCIRIDDILSLNHEVVKRWALHLTSGDTLLLEDSLDLAGFTVREFLSYFDALRRWSVCATNLAVKFVAKAPHPPNLPAPTQVVPYDGFVAGMVKLTTLPETTIIGITERLLYDNRTGSPDIHQQPLIRGDNVIAWSPRVVVDSREVRNLLRLMTRTPGLKKDAATIVGNRERLMLSKLGNYLATHAGYAFKVATDVEYGGEKGELDLLAYNPKYAEELLLIEGKTVLDADEINEVNAVTEEMIKVASGHISQELQRILLR